MLYGCYFNIADTNNGIIEINSYISKTVLQKGDPCIVFLEYDSKCVSDTYSYQDLTVDFIIRLGREHPELAIFSPLPKQYVLNQRGRSNRAIKKRLEITGHFYENCRGLLTMSKWLANDLIENTGIDKNKVHWVGGGCNIDITSIDQDSPQKKNGSRFLFVGKDWIRKNGPLVVDAFLKLKEQYSNVELYIAGPDYNPTKNEDGIKYLGRLSYDELAFYYNLCDYFVMPSQFEAYGIVFAEALIFGLPCIGKNCFAMPEFIKDGENGYLIQENDSVELMKKMKLLLENSTIRNNVLKNREYYISEYSWDTVAKRIINVMRNDGYFVE